MTDPKNDLEAAKSAYEAALAAFLDILEARNAYEADMPWLGDITQANVDALRRAEYAARMNFLNASAYSPSATEQVARGKAAIAALPASKTIYTR